MNDFLAYKNALNSCTLPCLDIRAPSVIHMRIYTHMYEDLFKCLDNARLSFWVYNNRNANKIVYFILKPKKNMKAPLL